MKKLLLITLCFLLLTRVAYSAESLDELEARTSRKSTNTFYSGEDSGNYYIWQPQTAIYKDTSTNHEVWIWTQTNDKSTLGTRYSATEYNWQPWSADGKRIAFYQDVDTNAYTRSGHPWFVARSDGSYWRPAHESAARASTMRFYYDWSPIIQDVAYATGANYDGNTGLDENAVYREVHTDTSITSTLIIDMIPGDTTTERLGGLKDRITGDGLYLVEGNYLEDEPYYVVQVEPAGSRQLKVSWDLPALDTYWYSTVNPADGHAHDEGIVGNSAHGYVMYFMPSGASVWWRIHLWGSDGNAPNHVQDHTSSGAPGYYSWWNDDGLGWDCPTAQADKEVQVVGDEYGQSQGNYPAFTTDARLSHSAFDRWGTHVVYSDVEASPIGPACLDIGSYTRVGYNSNPGGNQYSSYTGWSDYFVSAAGAPAAVMVATKYNSTTAADHITVGESHTSTTGDFQNPGQSPDGTKMVFRTDWLQPTSGNADLLVGVVYYPYPPEITQCSATGGTVTTRFDWRLDQANPRGYTTRGWPDEDDDDPPPPREIEKFRLWRSSDKSTWVPIGTVDHSIFSRYDFSDGTWDGNSYWEITDTPGNGTWYYAITSVEWSGLESRTLSNIYSITVSGGSGTGSQDTAYPSSPGDLDDISTSDFYTSFSSSYPELIRYYNVYAEDGSAPTVSQTNRIASISVNACSDGSCSWVDWLGNTGGTTQYVVTAVDTQGNESASDYVTNQAYTHKKSPATADGQYTIEWDDMSAAGSASGATYYVCEGGTGDGSSAAQCMDDSSISYDGSDTYLLKRGDTFWGSQYFYCTTNNETWSTYGSGDRPIITSRKQVTGSWTDDGAGNYYIDVGAGPSNFYASPAGTTWAAEETYHGSSTTDPDDGKWSYVGTIIYYDPSDSDPVPGSGVFQYTPEAYNRGMKLTGTGGSVTGIRFAYCGIHGAWVDGEAGVAASADFTDCYFDHNGQTTVSKSGNAMGNGLCYEEKASGIVSNCIAEYNEDFGINCEENDGDANNYPSLIVTNSTSRYNKDTGFVCQGETDGLETEMSYLSLTNCVSHDNGQSAGLSGHGVKFFWGYGDISGCLIYNNHEAGIYLQRCESTTLETTIENCIIFDNNQGSNADADDTSAITIWGTYEPTMNIYNNTFYGQARGFRSGGTATVAYVLNFKNNISVAPTLAFDFDNHDLKAGSSIDTNCYWDSDGAGGNIIAYDLDGIGGTYTTAQISTWNALDAMIGTDISSNPLFISSSPSRAWQFNIKYKSPCRSAGTDLSGTFTTDYYGTHRPIGSGWDIGAIEWTLMRSPLGRFD